MISITVKWDVKPEYADDFAALTREFGEACRNEPGCLFFEYTRSVERPTEFWIVEAYRDAEAGKAHVESEHFRKAMKTQGQYAVSRPLIVSGEIDQDDWAELGELEMPAE